jgi:colicin import membrane protein
MPGLLSRRARPWLGSAALHLVLIALLAVAALNWRSDAPSPQLAIEGKLVRYEDLPASVRAGKPLREPKPVTPPVVPQPKAEPPPPEPEPKVDDAARQQAEALELEQARLAAERQAEQQRAAEAEQAREAEVQKQRDAAARRQREADAMAAKQRADEAAAAKKRAADEAEARRRAEEAQQQAAAAAQQRQAEQQKAAREAKLKAEREAELKRALASEEEGEAIARSGIVDEYRALLTQAIERNWIRPPSARAGLECTLYVTQATGGTVLDVKVGECNGDQAVRESIANAVYRSSPLPAPRDPRAFERKLVMVFKPTE